MARKTEVVAEPGKPTIVITRDFDAPPRLVFEAWTRPDLVRKWWGGDRAELVVCEIDLRPGGAWRYVLRCPDGTEVPFKGVYREIAAPERIVNTFIYDVDGIRDRPATVTANFEERGRTTRVTELIVHQCVEDRDGHLQAGMEEGLSESFEHLDKLLRSIS